ncbi:MAG: hypothetical protein ACXWRE_04770 [Pseudobdellovibrionaceae bacterium]
MRNLVLKLSFVFASILAVSSAFAAETNFVALKGTVYKGSDFQGYQQVTVENASVIASSKALNPTLVSNFVKQGFAASVLPGSNIEVSDCNEAIVVIVGGKGNILPNDGGYEVYLEPKIVSFTCIN